MAALAISPDGKLLAARRHDHHVYIWDAATGKQIHRFESNNRNGVWQPFQFSPNGALLGACDNNGSVVLWDVASGIEVLRFEGTGPSIDAVSSIAFAPDGSKLALLDSKWKGHVFATENGKLLYDLPGDLSDSVSVVFSKDGKGLITSGAGNYTIWDAATGKKQKTFAGGGPRVALSPDGRLLATTGDGDQIIRLWDWEAGKLTRTFAARARRGPLAFSRDGKTLASAGDALRLWDVATGEPKGAGLGHHDRVATACYNLDGQTILTEGWDNTLRLWDASTAKELSSIRVPPTEKPNGKAMIGNLRMAQLSADGKSVALIRRDNTLFVWDLLSGKEPLRRQGAAIAFSPDGKLVACAEQDIGEATNHLCLIKLYDRKTGKELRSLRGHVATITSLAFTSESGCYSLVALLTSRPPARTTGNPRSRWSDDINKNGAGQRTLTCHMTVVQKQV